MSKLAAASTEPVAGLTGARLKVDFAYAVLAVVFLLAVLAQVYLAGLGAFAHHSGPQVVHHSYGAHENLGHYLGVAAGVLLILTLIARPNRSTVLGALLLAVLTNVAQEGLAQAGHDNRWVGGLHAFDGILILLLATWLAVTAYRRRLAR